MATTGFPASATSPERVPRKPLANQSLGADAGLGFTQEDQKENPPQRKPLPTIPIPHSGRIQGAPMSPVRINVRNDEYARPSSATIESHYPVRHVLSGNENEHHGREQFSGGSSNVRLERSPQREPQTNQAGQFQEAQSAEFIGGMQTSNAEEYDPYNLSNDFSKVDLAEPEEAAHEPLQYHHQSTISQDSTLRSRDHGYANQSPGLYGQQINRLLTPSSQTGRRSVIPRPASAYSAFSGEGQRGRSPGGRPLSYVDLLNTPYAEQQAPAPISFDNSDLRNVVGTNASLLSTQKTLEMYRMNVKKTNDNSIQYAFALFLIQAAQEAGLHEAANPSKRGSPKPKSDRDSPYIEDAPSSGRDLLREAKQILSKLADRSYPFAQYYLADGYASGLFNKNKEDYVRAFPLFVAASKHGHAESGYRAALCYEFGWGCRKDAAKAVQFYRQSASKNHPGAMTRLGRACLSGDLGLTKYREGLKWLRRATEAADNQYNAAPYHLGVLYESGYGDDVFQDETYSAQLFTQAADLGHVEASYRLGDAYEHGRLACPRDPALSVHFYTGAAQRGHAGAMMALCAWYMVGAEPVLEKDENEAYEWARRAAETGLTKAEYAVGYFTEMGIGCRRDPLEANMWYVRAAEAGDERAKHRIGAIRAAVAGGNPMEVAKPKSKDLAAKPPQVRTRGQGGKMTKSHLRESSLPPMSPVDGPLDSVDETTTKPPLQAIEIIGKSGKTKDDKDCTVM